MEFLSFKKLNVLFSMTMVLVLISVLVLFAWRAHSQIQQFDEYQEQMMQKQAQVVSSEVEELITSIRNRMIAISLDNFFLEDFEEFKSMDSLQESLQTRFQYYFPEMFAFTIADEHGDALGGDVHLFIGDVCRIDLQDAADKFKQKLPAHDYRPWIHPKPDAYHFDMMFPTHVLGETVVFFMSFKAELLQDAINRKTFTEHPIYLLKEDKPGLIEVSQNGVRDTLKRDYFLSEEELKSIAADVPVENTRWRIVVIPNSDLREQFVSKSYLDALKMFSGFLIFWIAFFIFGLYEEQRKARLMKHLHYVSSHDELTKLANRRSLYKAFKGSVKRKRVDDSLCGLLYLDLNQFKPVNDQYGHKMGDEVLKMVAKRLLACSREGDLVARIGGDEFVVLLNDLGETVNQATASLSEAETRFAEHLEPEYSIDGKVMHVPASIGSVLLQSEDETIDDLLKAADQKMYHSKQQIKASIA